MDNLKPNKPIFMDQDISSDEEEQQQQQRQRVVPLPHRRNSVSEDLGRPFAYLINVQKTRARILRHEDTDGDERVTIEDKGPKHVLLPSFNSGGYQRRSIKGNYMVSTLLQELSLLEASQLSQHGPHPLGQTRNHAIIHDKQLHEHPGERLTRMIKQYFWPALVRKVDAEGMSLICNDPKNRASDKRPRIYVPHDDPRALQYFLEVAKNGRFLDLEVIRLPSVITPEYVVSINDRPGILALDLAETIKEDGTRTLTGKPFIVPGGRFNEMYGWDSYFAVLGLLDNVDGSLEMLKIAKSMGDNFVYQIKHYGKVVNANRSYYLLRSQPPFLTDFALRVYERLDQISDRKVQRDILGDDETAESWLKKLMQAAITEYRTVWMVEPRLVTQVGLSRYCPTGRGVPPETEESHFDSCLYVFAEKYGVGLHEFVQKYNCGEIVEPDLDEYFMHDGAVRESGHDTTYRLDGRAANLCTVDLCALLYKYECDIADFLEKFDPKIPGEDPQAWREAAERRKGLSNQYLWDEGKGMYFDYDIKEGKQIEYESATMFWSLWAGLCSAEQAERLVKDALPKFEAAGGLVSGTKGSLGGISLDRPTRQWDYPTGWAPHQMLLWNGLHRYGYGEEASRFAYRWLYMITRAFSDFNGVVPEKFDVVKMSHRVDAEYGNVGTDFKRVPQEGFAWMNASYLVGMSYLTRLQRRALGALVPPESLIESLLGSQPIAVEK